jgi:hypothetical protein
VTGCDRVVANAGQSEGAICSASRCLDAHSHPSGLWADPVGRTRPREVRRSHSGRGQSPCQRNTVARKSSLGGQLAAYQGLGDRSSDRPRRPARRCRLVAVLSVDEPSCTCLPSQRASRSRGARPSPDACSCFRSKNICFVNA